MANTGKIFTKHWRAIAWTAGYIFLVWAILHGLFNFNIFSWRHLSHLPQVELHGFAGLVFGLLILSAIPLYIATTVLTVRNKSVPIRIPLPKCFTAPPPPAPEPVPEPVITEQETLPQLHAGIPAEMRDSFMRAQKNYGARQMSIFNRPNSTGNPLPSTPAPQNTATVPAQALNDATTPTTSTNHTVSESGAFPIPTDFDIDTEYDSPTDVPVFSDINFDDDDEDDAPIETVETDNTDLRKYLADSGINSDQVDNLVIVGDFAIAVHDDDDFWVADELDWFAAGRQKPSPIVELLNARDENNKKPMFLIEQSNIMELESNVQKWRDSGITVVTSRAELLDILHNTTNN